MREAVRNRKKNVFLSWTFYAFMFSIPFDVMVPNWLPSTLQGSLSIPRIVGTLLCVLFFMEVKPDYWRRPPAFFAFVTYVIFLLFSFMWGSKYYHIIVFQQMQMLILFYVSYNIFLMRRIVYTALFSFVLSCSFVSIMMITGQIADNYQLEITGGRLSAFGADPNIYSGILVIGVICALGITYITKWNRKRYRKATLMMAFTILIAVFRSGSRGSSLSLLGLGLFLFAKGSFKIIIKRLAFGTLFISIYIAFIVANGYPNLLIERWKTTLETGNTSNRGDIVSVSVEIIKEHPVFGMGTRAKSEISKRLGKNSDMTATHNMILTMLTYIGIMGAIPYLYAYIKVFKASMGAIAGMEYLLPLSIFVAIFIQDMVSGGLPSKLHWIMFAYIFASFRSRLLIGSQYKTKCS